MQYYEKSISHILKEFHIKKSKGLNSSQVKRRLKKYGKNVLPRSGEVSSRLKIFFDQWKSPLILILLVASLVSGLLTEFIDMTVILITVGVNVMVGFIQEDKANRALKKLRHMVEYHALVLRDGKKISIKSDELVPGDIVFLEAGDKIQADGRIISAYDFTADEAVLTGESEPVKKKPGVIKKKVVVGDRYNMVHRSTIVTAGEATVVVTATGLKTQIGKIAKLVKKTGEQRTPLQHQLLHLSKMISVIILTLSVLIFILGAVIRKGDYTLFELFETAVAVAVAAIPEGLVISLTVILAIGMQFILKRNALVRKLVAAETLGSVSYICTDKTGTLTEGRMKITAMYVGDRELDKDEIGIVNVEKHEKHDDELELLKAGVLCNNATLNEAEDVVTFLGDTTEVALAEAALSAGLEKANLEGVYRRIDELPFDSEHKFMATLNKVESGHKIFIKGAPEVLLEKSSYYYSGGRSRKMTDKKRKDFEKKASQMAASGLRVLAVGYKKVNKDHKRVEMEDIDGSVLLGLVAMSDPLRSDVKKTLKIARKAGIEVIMITGDHVKTAQAIALELGLPAKSDQIFDGEKLGKIDSEQLKKALSKVRVFARVNPKDKIRIVDALREKGEVVAMTGDGVNDAPALKGADIGVALGSGTDVAKEISDLVLLDNNFNTIVAAVEEGRGIYQNIKKVILYLLSGSFAEVVLISGSLIAGLPLAVLPAQILWVNLIEDSFPNMALAFDKGDKENMNEPPRRKGTSIIDSEMKVMIAIISIVSNLVLFAIFWYFWKTTGDIVLTRTIVFIGLGIDSLLYIYSVRSMRHMIWEINPFSNRYLTAAVLFGWVMLFGAVYWSPLQTLLRTVPLSAWHWVILIVFGFVNIFLIEFVKAIYLIWKKRLT